MYMVYMTMGTIFIMSLGFEVAYKEIWLGGEFGVGLSEALDYVMESPGEEEEELEGYPVRVNGTHMIPVVSNRMYHLVFDFDTLHSSK